MEFQYIIFDMDGTLLDSIPYWKRLARNYMEDLKVTVPDDLDERLTAMSVHEAGRWLKKEYYLNKTAEEITRELCGRIEKNYAEDIMPKPGVRAWLSYLKEKGIPMCVATASSAALGKQALLRNGLLSYFDFMVDCGMVGVGKTNPAVYHLAAEKFGGKAAACAVAEDAAFALKTAKEAGFFTIGVYESSEPDQESVRKYSDKYVKNFEELIYA